MGTAQRNLFSFGNTGEVGVADSMTCDDSEAAAAGGLQSCYVQEGSTSERRRLASTCLLLGATTAGWSLPATEIAAVSA